MANNVTELHPVAPDAVYEVRMTKAQMDKIHIGLIYYNSNLTLCEPLYRDELKALIDMSNISDPICGPKEDCINGWAL